MMKKALCVLLCAALLLGLPFAAGAETAEAVSWSLEGNVLCISGEIEAAEVYPWADGANSVTTLRISDGVTEIPAGAFRNFVALQYVTIPQTLRYIGDSAFENCALLRWVRMPDSLIGIGERAFAGCTKLSAVYLPERVAWIGDRAFDATVVVNCSANSAGQDYIADNGGTYRQTGTHTLASAKGNWGKNGTWTLENGTLTLSGSGEVTCGADGRYPWDAYRADIQTVELGAGITALGKDAFALCRKLEKITFPASIETVDEAALDGRAEIVGYAGTAAQTFAENRGLTFTAIEAGEKLGFLPGDLQSKVDPYLRPLYDALYQIMGAESFQKNMEKGLIEVAPLAYMRGRTLDNAFIILDEAQNTTPAQMKMFLTRIGFGSKVVVTGDQTQKDLPRDVTSGLDVAMKVLSKVDEIGFVKLTNHDVVRHPLVQKIVKAYEEYENRQNKKEFDRRNRKESDGRSKKNYDSRQGKKEKGTRKNDN